MRLGVTGRSRGKGAYDQDALYERMYVCMYDASQNIEVIIFFSS